MRIYLRSRIEGQVTGANFDYGGSISIGYELMKEVGIDEGEQVHVVNRENGERFITYAIKGIGDEIRLNGAAARMGLVGDRVIIMAYEVR